MLDLTHPFDAADDLLADRGGLRARARARPARRRPATTTRRTASAAAEHGGTHLDAPIHFHAGGASVDQIPLEQLVGPGVRIDVTRACAEDRDHEVARRRARGLGGAARRDPARRDRAAAHRLRARWPDRARYLGTDRARAGGASRELHFPGLAADAARWLVEEREIRAVGIDTASIDHGPSTSFETHQALFARNVPAFENVAGLEQLPARGFRVVALPMKIRGGSGAPLRIVAFVPDQRPGEPTR